MTHFTDSLVRGPSGAGRRLAAAAALLLLSGAGRAFADTTALTVPGMCVDDATGVGAGTATWNNPANAQSSTDGQASATAPLGPSQASHYLKCTNFGLNVPTGSTINGITMQTSHRRQTAVVADDHVYPVRSDNAQIGSVGTDEHHLTGSCSANDWTGSFNTATYGGGTDIWGVTTWGACPASASVMGKCPDGSFNVNDPNFGVAIAAKECSGTGSASVDWVKVQVDYTVPDCAGSPWGTPFTVVAANSLPGVQTGYTIGALVPNLSGCALTSSTTITITFPSNTDVSSVTSGTFNMKSLGTISRPTAQTVSFTVPSAALVANACGTQACLKENSAVTIVLNGVTNPTVDGEYQLQMTGTSVLSGATGKTGTTTSDKYNIMTPCTPTGASASHWSTPGVSLGDANQSLLPGCPKVTKYTIDATVPTPGGCKLVKDQSVLAVTLPSTPAGSDVSHITSATINGTAVPAAGIDLTGAAFTVKLTTPVDVLNGQPLKIELDAVQNPSAAASPKLTLTATSTRLGAAGAGQGSTASDQSATYAINATTTCTPTLDFYVRDWTTDATTHDDGNVPYTTPEPDWAKSSDVWNQNGSTGNTPDPLVNDWIAGEEPAIGDNYAYARVSLKTTGTLQTYRPVTAHFYFSPFGTGSSFSPLGDVTQTLVSSDPSTILAPLKWSPTTAVPGSVPVVGQHMCLAVEIESQTEPLINSLNGGTPGGGGTDPNVRGDNNKAQRNLELVAMPGVPPSPPPPPSGGAGPMAHYAIIHNGALMTRDITIRYDAPADVAEHLRDPKVQVVSGETTSFRPRGTMTLTNMQPGENRWVALTYSSLTAGVEGAMLPVSFSEMAGDTVVNAFTFGIKPSTMETVAKQNLQYHHGIFGRLATGFGVALGKEEVAAAAALLREKSISEERYMHFLTQHQKTIGVAVSRFLGTNKSTDPFEAREALGNFDESVRSGKVARAATAHLALLEKLDAFEAMRQMAKGNPADVLQMVRWQKELYATQPRLKDLGAAAYVVNESQEFIDAWGKRKKHADTYAELIKELLKSFRSTAVALEKGGTDLGPEIKQLQQRLKSTAALEKAHREYLLKLQAAAQ